MAEGGAAPVPAGPPAAAGPRGSGAAGVAIAAAICAAGLFCYLPMLRGDVRFVLFDDDVAVYLNPLIRSLDWPGIRSMFTDRSYAPHYNPLLWLGLAINYRLGGLDPFGYHAGSLLLHLLNGVLLYRLLRSLLLAARPAPPGGERRTDIAAGVAALLWVVHPLQVESVAWAAMRLYPQAAFFLLGSLASYLRAARSRDSPFRSGWYWGSLAAFTASLLTHQNGLTLVGVLLVLDVFPLRRLRLERGRLWSGETRRVLLEKLPFLAVSFAILAISLQVRLHPTEIWNPPPTLGEFPLTNRVLQGFYLWGHYLWKPWWPLHLSPIYTTLFAFKDGTPASGRFVTFDPEAPLFVASAALVAGVTVLVVLLRRRCPALLAAWVCHLLLLLPLLGPFNLPYYPSDRYGYLQGMVWSGVAAAGLVHLGDRLRARLHPLALLAFPVALLVAAAVLTNRQVRVWTNSETLFRHMLAEFGTDPYRWDIHLRLGRHYLLEGRIPEAVDQFDRTLALVPGEPRTLYFKGMALLQAGEGALSRGAQPQDTAGLFLAAADTLDRSAEALPAPEPLGAAGFAHAHLGRLQDAEDRLARGLQLSPGDVRMRLGLGMVLHRQGRDAEAIAQLDEAVRADPGLAAQREQILSSWNAFDAAPAAGR